MRKLMWRVIAVLGMAGVASPALSCACCTDPGDRFDGPVALDDYYLDQLQSIHMGSRAQLYTTACWLDCVEGISNPQEEYQVTFTNAGTDWAIGLRNGEAGGDIRFSLPEQLHVFSTDPEPTSGVTRAGVYKEWRVKAPISGSGDFSAATGAEAELVFIGRGNRCDDAGHYRHWRLQVTGEGVDFALFGSLLLGQ